MAIDGGSDGGMDSQGMMLVMFNAIQALVVAHPNPAAVREILERAGEQQIESFELGDADTELKESYEFYSARLLDSIPTTNEAVGLYLDLKL